VEGLQAQGVAQAEGLLLEGLQAQGLSLADDHGLQPRLAAYPSAFDEEAWRHQGLKFPTGLHGEAQELSSKVVSGYKMSPLLAEQDSQRVLTAALQCSCGGVQ